MQSYRIMAVGDRTADTMRKTLRSPGYGHPDTNAGCYDFLIKRMSKEGYDESAQSNGGASHE